MAKQLVNPIERHVEKAVLGLTGLALIAAIGLFLVSSPNQLELGGQAVKPGTIDQVVAQKAASVREAIRRAPADVEMPDPLQKEFEEGLRPFAAGRLTDTWPVAAPLQPDVPIIDAPGVVTGQRDLARVVALEQSRAISGRSTLLLGGLPVPSNWVTVTGVLDVKKQMAALAKEYGAAKKNVIFGPILVERRARHEDGAWSDDDWAPIEPLGMDRFPALPQVTLVPEGDHFTFSTEDQSVMGAFLKRMEDPVTQLAIIRPMMPTILNGAPWSLPVVTSERDVLLQDDYYLNPGKPPSANPLNRYLPFEETATPQGAEETPDQMLARAESLRKSAWEHKSMDEIIQAHNLALGVEEDKTLGASIRQRAKRLREEVGRVDDDIKRYRQKHPMGDAGSPGAVAVTREPPPQQQVWIHDAQPNSVVSGKTYQYRIRATIYNVLAGEPDKFRNPLDSAQFFIPGPWTEPTEVTIKPDTYSFLVSDDQRNREVGVELYRWFEGVWVKSRFKYAVGDRLTGQARCKVPPTDGGDGFETPLVEFVADATVVDIDFKRSHRERKRGSGRNGVQFAGPSSATSVVFVDQDGRLQERFVPTDRGSPEKREISVWEPKKGT